MSTWKEFEEECFLYLKDVYSSNNVKFTKLGESDSTLPDIKVELSNSSSFYIEVKKNNAQCGQFVLIPEKGSRTFCYSEGNKSDQNEYSAEIIEYMQKKFDVFISAGTKGEEILLDEEIFYKWIINFYETKGVKYIITKGNDNIIFPLNKLRDYFNVSATYRMKKSGSSHPSIANKAEIVEKLLELGYEVSTTNIGKKFIIRTNSPLKIEKLKSEKYTFLLKKIKDNHYEVRRLSNTCNSNVIFSINLFNEQIKEDLNDFETAIKKTTI